MECGMVIVSPLRRSVGKCRLVSFANVTYSMYGHDIHA